MTAGSSATENISVGWVSDWQYDVANGDTKLGYLDWIAHNRNSDVVCYRCGEEYDEAKGDGYCGLCPSCADKDGDYNELPQT